MPTKEKRKGAGADGETCCGSHTCERRERRKGVMGRRAEKEEKVVRPPQPAVWP